MNLGTLLKGETFFVGVFALLFAACGDSGGGKEALTPEEVGVETIEDLPNCSKAREGDSVLVEEDSLAYVCRGGKWTPAESADGDSTKTAPASSSAKDSLQESLAGGVQTMDDLPNCSKNREGDSVLVVEDSLTYICRSGKWEEKKYLIDSVKTEDDLPACTKGHEGDSAYVSGEYAVYVCSENVWKKDQSIVQVYKSADDMPNCTKKLADVEAISTVDSLLYQCDGERWQEMATTYASAEKLPNCTDNREGNQAFLLDTREKFQCAGKQWKAVEQWSDAPGSPATQSSSSKGSSASSSPVKYGTLTDSRDGQTYKTVTIGTQIWMAQNLNYDDGYGVCPMKEAGNCEKYGRLYRFNGAGKYWNYDEDSSRVYSSNICPTGWRLPDSLDYAELIAYVSKNNGGEPVGVSLKATTGWISEGETVIIEGGGSGILDSTRVGASRGTDRFGFAALPAGSCWDERCYIGDDTRFFFSTPREGGSYKLAFDKDSLIYDKDGGYGYISVRCLKGEASSSTVSSTSSSSNESSSGSAFGTLTDSRDGQTYKTVTIGTQVWMAENLNYETTNSYCYNDTATYCDKYGRLYTWAAAMDSAGTWTTNGMGCGYGKTCSPTYPVRGVCPSGWHLPSQAEWDSLFTAVGGRSTAGQKLKSMSGWSSSGDGGDDNGTDAFGFSALPAGYYNGGGFYYGGLVANFWSSTENNGGNAYYVGLYYGYGNAYLEYGDAAGFSVRCLKN
ncbi:MAG: hypothetical protein II819_00310 [Fibrobacter sp.]|nr:hypothetical protein [Fibrobacter sp.]